ncbi:hypothetical protein DHEL01_v204754 [Diaporthe helianthi]|uniref:Uncharacterized protein n=1 Tax=Diaporthe helianthi TaxID=158607 RepID=A0A2P5I2W2_DIAHE|nr:hypothetical protein DHEL01_v204754 [Diaporthe helianthi]
MQECLDDSRSLPGSPGVPHTPSPNGLLQLQPAACSSVTTFGAMSSLSAGTVFLVHHKSSPAATTCQQMRRGVGARPRCRPVPSDLAAVLRTEPMWVDYPDYLAASAFNVPRLGAAMPIMSP